MSEYDASQIQVLSGMEAVRKRPGMYIGHTTSEGFEGMVFVLVDDVVAQFRAHEVTEMAVNLGPDSWVTVRDDGLGIPPDQIEAVVSTLHHRPHSRMDRVWPRGSIHGVGPSVVNALSERFEVELTYQGIRWAQAYERGAPVSRVRRLGPTSLQGTQIRFRPDPTIFPSVELEPKAIEWRLRDLALCLPHLRVFMQERRVEGRGGLAGLVRGLSTAVQVIHVIESCFNGQRIDIALAWSNERSQPRLVSYANCNVTRRGGTHLDGLWAGLLSYARTAGSAARTHSAVRELLGSGLVAAIHVEVPDARYDSMARERLCTPRVADAVRSAIVDSLTSEPSYAAVRRCVDARLGVARSDA